MIAASLLILFSQAQHPDLAADKRLDSNIEFRADAVAAPELCARFAKATGVVMSASPALRDDVVVLYARGKPASEVMKRMAEHFHWEWVRNGEGYELRQPSNYAAFEAQEYRAEVLARTRPTIEQAKTAALRFAANPPAKAVAGAIKAIKEQIEEERKTPQEFEGEGGVTMPMARLNRLLLANPYVRLATVATANLTDNQLIELDRQRVVFSTDPKPLQRPFGAAARAMADSLCAQLAQVRNAANALLAKEPAEVRERLESSLGEALDPSQVKAIRVVMPEPGGATAEVVNWQGQITHRESGPMLQDETLDSPEAWEKQRLAYQSRPRYTGPPADNPALDKPLPDSKPLRQEFSDAMELLRSSSTIDLTRLLLRQGLEAEPLTRLGRYLSGLASAGGFCVVSDCFDRQLVPCEPEPLARTTRQAIEQWARTVDSTWTYRDGWVTMRSADWASDRAAQPPRQLLGSAGALRFRQYGLSFEQLADFAGNLPLAQLESPVWEALSWAPRTADGSRIQRFWAALPRSAREQLRSGRTMTVGHLPDAARQRLTDWLQSSQGDRGMVSSPPNSINGDPRFEDTWPPYSPELERLDREITEKTPAEISSAVLEVRYVGLPVIATLYDEELHMIGGIWSPPMLASCTVAPTGQLKGDSAELFAGQPRYMTQDIYRIRVRLPGLPPVTTFVDGLQDVGLAEFDATKWPPQLRRRVEAAWKAKGSLQ